MRRALPLWSVLACACGHGGDPKDADTDPGSSVTTPTGPPEVTAEVGLPTVLPDGGVLLGVRKLSIAANEPVVVSLEVTGDGTDREVSFQEMAANQDLPVLGLRLGKDYQVVATATNAAGQSTVLPPLELPADAPPADWPVIDVLANDTSRVQTGWILVEAKNTTDNTHLIFLDPDLQPTTTWSYVYDLQDTDLAGDGTLLTRTDANGWQIDLLGNVVHQWGYEELDPPAYLPTATEEFHHEIIPLGSQFATLSSREISVDAFPTDYDHPTVLGGPADLWDSSLAVIDSATGNVVNQWFVSDYLDTTRISFDALTYPGVDDLYGVYDWAHANAADQDLDGGWVIAVRHQDVTMKLDAQGNLVWLLGDHAGWGPAWQPYLLDKSGLVQWPYHPHGVSVDKATGLVLMMDNGNNAGTPYDPDPDPHETSRAVAFRVDEANKTVSQEWEFEVTTNGKLFSRTQGATYLEPNDNVFTDFGVVEKEDGVQNTDNGWGDMDARIVEWAQDQPQIPVLDLRLRSDAAVDTHGWTTYRANKVPSLYPTTGPWRATEVWK